MNTLKKIIYNIKLKNNVSYYEIKNIINKTNDENSIIDILLTNITCNNCNLFVELINTLENDYNKLKIVLALKNFNAKNYNIVKLLDNDFFKSHIDLKTLFEEKIIYEGDIKSISTYFSKINEIEKDKLISLLKLSPTRAFSLACEITDSSEYLILNLLEKIIYGSNNDRLINLYEKVKIERENNIITYKDLDNAQNIITKK